MLAHSADLDLIEINPNRVPPIVKMADWGKYRYEMEKRQREAKTKTKTSDLKEIRLTRKIDSHDLETKTRRAKEWLAGGDKVRVFVPLKGREYLFADQAIVMLNQFAATIGGIFEQSPAVFGNRVIAIIRKW